MNARPTVRLPITVVPGSSRNCVAGWLGGRLKVRVTAAAERGKANSAVETVLSEALAVPKSSVTIVRGGGSRRKVIEIRGVSESEVYRRLSKGAGSSRGESG